MAARTKMEVEALASKILEIIYKEIEKKKKQAIPEAKKRISKKLSGLLKERNIIRKRIDTEVKKLGMPNYTYETEEYAIDVLARKLSGKENISQSKIEREIVLAGDQGAEVLIKNIVEMFLK